MITGTAQQRIRTQSSTAISAVKENNPKQSSPVSDIQAQTASSNTSVVDVSTSQSLADIAKKYDVRNMSPQEMATMSQELYQSGTISFQDHALLSFQPELSPQANQVLPGLGDQADTPKDFIAQWETQLQTHEKLGDVTSTKNDQRMLNILGNLAALHQSATST
ncbi:MAG TPA: hypothetical protein VGK09_13000 [Rhodocyclaceae bacterium]|jgi:hypothetical protein